MSDFNDMPPADRAKVRLLTLIEQSECAGSTFNPWPLAELDARLQQLKEAGELAEWSRLQGEYRAADDAWAGPIIRRPMLQRQAAGRCINLKQSIGAGDSFAVVEAVAACATHGLVIPAWLASAFVSRYQRVATGECRSWSDEQAFGAAFGKGANLAGLKAQIQVAPWAYEVAMSLLAKCPSRPIDRALFEEVGGIIGAGQTKVQALIVGYLQRSDGLHPPLVYVRASLKAGLSLADALGKWGDEQYEVFLRSAGFAPGADGVWGKHSSGLE